jgi:cytochrome c oxidase assembly protein subunit 15
MTTIAAPRVDDDASRNDRQIAIWLFIMCALLFAMILVGGLTRLTDSGLSITEWKPVTGAIPPMSAEAWESEFAKYQQIPEYAQINQWMTLGDFKSIYWWEWGHRFLGRFIGIAFFIPFVYFFFTRKIRTGLTRHLTAMFVLGGAQGVLGWYMVMSGLSERVDVSQYRLAAHLALAFLIAGYILWVALSLVRQSIDNVRSKSAFHVRGSSTLLGLMFLQIILGAFVAGIHAGKVNNTWPLMDSGLLPEGAFAMSPWVANFFENHGLVQFDHRMLAYIIAIVLGYVWWRARNSITPPAIVLALDIFVAAAGLQILLGIWTLLAVAPISLSALHQAGGALAFMAAVNYAQLSWTLVSADAAQPAASA